MTSAVSDEAFADALIAEIDALGARAYSEIGVPAFLVAEALSPNGTLTSPRPEPADDLAAKLARIAAAIATRRPALDAATIAQVLEVLADRYFMASATPFSRTVALHPSPS